MSDVCVVEELMIGRCLPQCVVVALNVAGPRFGLKVISTVLFVEDILITHHNDREMFAAHRFSSACVVAETMIGKHLSRNLSDVFAVEDT